MYLKTRVRCRLLQLCNFVAHMILQHKLLTLFCDLQLKITSSKNLVKSTSPRFSELTAVSGNSEPDLQGLKMLGASWCVL